jgi:hypothetical protein
VERIKIYNISNKMENISTKIDSKGLAKMPDEVLLKIMSYLDIKSLLKCSQLSKRLRIISFDETLWVKIILSEGQMVPSEFIKFVLENGCKYLSLRKIMLTGTIALETLVGSKKACFLTHEFWI